MMARYVDAIDLAVPIETAFDYLADFSRAAEWDPGVIEAERITKGKLRVGSRFHLLVNFLGRRIPLEYRLDVYERPSRLVFKCEEASVSSIDEITFVARGQGGTRVTYDARLELVGLLRVADPMLNFVFQHMGRVAIRGIGRQLGRVRASKSAGKRKRPRALKAQDTKQPARRPAPQSVD